MNFLEAVEQMKQGKTTKRKSWNFEAKIQNDSIKVFWKEDNKDYILDLFDFEATDWEVVEEKKTLSDKIDVSCAHCVEDMLRVSDVKKALKEFIDRLSSTIISEEDLAKEIFGEKLI